MEDKINTDDKIKAVYAGAILIIIGVALFTTASIAVEKGRQAEYDRRMEYLVEKYPTYRPPEFSQQLFAPYPPQPEEGLKTVGLVLAGIGLLMIFIKLVQGMN